MLESLLELVKKLAEAIHALMASQAGHQLIPSAAPSIFDGELLTVDHTGESTGPLTSVLADYSSNTYAALDQLFDETRHTDSLYYLTTLPSSVFLALSRPAFTNFSLDSFGADKKAMRLEATLHLDRFYAGKREEIELTRKLRAELLEKQQFVQDARRAITTHKVPSGESLASALTSKAGQGHGSGNRGVHCLL